MQQLLQDIFGKTFKESFGDLFSRLSSASTRVQSPFLGRKRIDFEICAPHNELGVGLERLRLADDVEVDPAHVAGVPIGLDVDVKVAVGRICRPVVDHESREFGEGRTSRRIAVIELCVREIPKRKR